jgi:hypothetical protein
VAVLRDIGIWQCDAGMHNVLYDRESGVVTLLDFENVAEYADDDGGQAPDLLAIFGIGEVGV